MKRRTYWFFTLLLLAVCGVPVAYAQDDVGAMVGRVNSLRASLGLYSYTVSSALTVAAQQQAQWIVETGNVSHTHPDGSGPRTRAVNAGYPSTDVTENIYGGTMATVDIAWNFWMNSGIHYAGLVNRRYTDVGFGVARGDWGTAYVAVFGNPGGPAPFVAAPAAAGSSAGGDGGVAVAAASGPPSYVVGSDRSGNIMHEVQPGDTLGDIAMIYGYTWDDLPELMSLNGLTDVMDLEVGSIFLVPPASGTYTPSPVGDTPTPAASQPPTWTPRATFSMPVTPTPWATTGAAPPVGPATAGAAPAELLEPGATSTAEAVAAPLIVQAPTEAGTPALLAQGTIPGVTITRSGPSPWLGVALVVQVAILVGAAFEFIRRARRRR